MTERDEKTARVTTLAARLGLRGVLWASPAGFAWMTGGGTNRIDVTRDPGAAALLVTADGRRHLLANAIEAPRLAAELPEPPDEIASWPWIDERIDPRLMAGVAQRLAGGGPIAADATIPGTTPLEPALAALRHPLVAGEVDRLRRLGRDAGESVGAALRRVEPGEREHDVAARVAAAVARIGARPHVLLCGGDDRLDRFRHPVPTGAVWRHAVMVAVCAERDGLIVALSRIVMAGDDGQRMARVHAAASVYAALVGATRPGVTAAGLYETAAAAYAAAGHDGEIARHHQGGAIGYRSREWVAHPANGAVVQAPQAFAWNPSLPGAKVEDTVLVTAAGAEPLTASPDWPIVTIGGVPCTLPLVR